MNRKLAVLNVVLAGAVVYAGVELRRQWTAAKEREFRMQSVKTLAAPPRPFTKLPEVAPVMATSYSTVVQKFLLDPTRDPNLPIEVKPAPPPPPPMPPMPLFHGMMDIGNGPEIILSVKSGAENKRLHPGEAIGEFTVVAFNAEQVELEWNSQRIIKSLVELAGHSAGPQTAEASQPEAPQQTVRPKPVDAPVGPADNANASGERACVDGDTMPVGTVKDGVVKTIVKNALLGSENCIWKPVGR